MSVMAIGTTIPLEIEQMVKEYLREDRMVLIRVVKQSNPFR